MNIYCGYLRSFILRRNWIFELCDVFFFKNYIYILVYVFIYVGYMIEFLMLLGVGGGIIFNDYFNYKLVV